MNVCVDWGKTKLMNRIHLVVLQPNAHPDHDPTQVAALFNPNRHEFIWNADFTAFRPVTLRWYDDASYARYQAGDNQE